MTVQSGDSFSLSEQGSYQNGSYSLSCYVSSATDSGSSNAQETDSITDTVTATSLIWLSSSAASPARSACHRTYTTNAGERRNTKANDKANDQNQAHARCFVQGLLHQGERRNSENIAQAVAGGNVRNLQAFITTGAWLDAAVLADMRRCVLEVLADDDAVCNYDETGFPKKGSKSVGVKRQYSGTLGRTDNCQVGVFANYHSLTAPNSLASIVGRS